MRMLKKESELVLKMMQRLDDLEKQSKRASESWKKTTESIVKS